MAEEIGHESADEEATITMWLDKSKDKDLPA